MTTPNAPLKLLISLLLSISTLDELWKGHKFVPEEERHLLRENASMIRVSLAAVQEVVIK